MTKPSKAATPAPVRCAVYTRKSTEEGLDQAFNSFDAQREAGEAYVKSQVGEGWELLPDRYDDGGFSGGTTDRPALRRLMRAVEAGEVDCVVVYKVDRLSRSLPDFARLMETFDQARVSFVSVTQQFNTATSMGRLVLNVLLSFAQFEREIISERTRDKIAATRRKGKWSGGRPVLGYDVDRASLRLVVNDVEAERVRAIFGLYREHGSLLTVVEELARRGWSGKRWVTRGGEERGSRPFTRTALYQLLTNVLYAGKVRYREEVHPGEHAAILDEPAWQQVQALLARNGRAGAFAPRGRSQALLQGVLRCGPCNCAMTPTHATKNGTKRYRYYVCSAAQKNGRRTCPSKSVPAGAIEDLVVRQVAATARDESLIVAVVEQVRRQDEEAKSELEAERRALARALRNWHAELLATAGATGEARLARVAEVQEMMAAAETRSREIGDEAARLQGRQVSRGEVLTALEEFGAVWSALTPREQTRAVWLLIDRVEYDGSRGKLSVAFRPTGIRALARERAAQPAGGAA